MAVAYDRSTAYIASKLLKHYRKTKPVPVNETAAFLQEQASSRSGKHAKLLKHLDKLTREGNGRDQLFNLYNQMYGSHESRSFLLINPDHNAYIKSEKNKRSINGILAALKKQDLSTFNDIDCLQRNCDIWQPINEGNCYTFNK